MAGPVFCMTVSTPDCKNRLDLINTKNREQIELLKEIKRAIEEGNSKNALETNNNLLRQLLRAYGHQPEA